MGYYGLISKSGGLYVGSTIDLLRITTREKHVELQKNFDLPTSLIYSEEFETFHEAHQREAQVKRWSRSKKEALASGDLAKLRKLAKSSKEK